MKVFNTVLKIVSALVFVAGAVFVVATYGDKIVAWAKKMLASCPCCKGEAVEEPVEEAAAEEDVAEEAPAEEAPAEEAPAQEAPAAEEDVVAGEADFEG